MKTVWLVRYNNGQADVFDEEQPAPAWPYVDAFESEETIKELEDEITEVKKMCVHRIVKAATFGKKEDWQTCAEFRKEAMRVAREKNLDEYMNEEAIDDLVLILHEMGHVILSEG